jgi:pimeloyl-ACP methyl ester carboxylesterase
MSPAPTIVAAGRLAVALRSHGPSDGWPCLLMHGFPYDVEAYAEVAPILADAGARVITPYLRGFGPTRFRSPDTPRSGEQAALAADLVALLDALAIPQAVLAGYDWGGRAACVTAALWPERVAALVTANGYNLHDVARSTEPGRPAQEAAYWYQYYFHGERGRRGLDRHRHEIARLLWRSWSPNWAFDDATFARTAASFDNPDFVAVVIHSYRHRYGLALGDPAVADIEARLAAQPPITVPTIAIDGTADGVRPEAVVDLAKFTGPIVHRFFDGAGHNLPQERPADWARAVLDARGMRSG